MKKIFYRLIYLPSTLWYKVMIGLLELKHKLFQPYYVGLAVQARYLYRQSPLFRYRWQEPIVGLELAEKIFEENMGEQLFFMHLAQKEPFRIRLQIFLDALLGKEPRPYFLHKEE